ncbi:probable oligoribonuclease [Ctenocephalides felis]|uniref:probable oligoribonuclease n=1 Tax=Ctenocephalides felis TaxID=7515 RepID=UPI000E6E4085|nr:probable oligoribonuclease [Ctenocephalides felis]
MNIVARKIRQISFSNLNIKNMSSKKYSTKNRIVWIDMEMTGLDINKDKIIEIACIVTESDLSIVDTCPSMIIHHSDDVLNSMNEWCKVNLGKTGLIDECKKSTTTLEEAEGNILQFLKKNIAPKECPVAGNSVYMDRLFLQKYMPVVDQYLHYRIIDVSSIKELCKRWNENFYKNAPRKNVYIELMMIF